MKNTIATILAIVFSISSCVAQNPQTTQTRQQIERRYQDAIESARKNFSERRYSQAKQDYLTAIGIKPENAAFINDIITEIDKLLPAEASSGRQSVQNAGSDRSSPVANYQETIVPGVTLAAKLDWLVRSAESHNTYIVEVSSDENIAPRSLGYKGAIDITVILKGDDINRTIRLSSHGNMFTVNSDVTFILDRNITLQGHNGNSGSMVYVDGGTFKMNSGATITGNIKASRNSNGGGVYVEDGTFEMNGGTISDNTVNTNGGGVYLSNPIGGKAIFNMNGGIISDNTSNESGGGVYAAGGTFKMTGGTISGNTANKGGGVSGYTFSMYGGTITGNTASEYGGGIYSRSGFTKTGGTITGYNSDRSNGNVVRDDSGVLARRGHAAYYENNPYSSSGKLRKETTAGSGVNLSSESTNNWDQ